MQTIRRREKIKIGMKGKGRKNVFSVSDSYRYGWRKSIVSSKDSKNITVLNGFEKECHINDYLIHDKPYNVI